MSNWGRYYHDPLEEYASHHETHPELDHDFDHFHDTHPYNFHEHGVHRSPRADSVDNEYEFGDLGLLGAKHEGLLYDTHATTHVPTHAPYHHPDAWHESWHEDRRHELDHKYDWEADVRPFEFHEHSVKEAFDYGKKHGNDEERNDFDDFAFAA